MAAPMALPGDSAGLHLLALSRCSSGHPGVNNNCWGHQHRPSSLAQPQEDPPSRLTFTALKSTAHYADDNTNAASVERPLCDPLTERRIKARMRHCEGCDFPSSQGAPQSDTSLPHADGGGAACSILQSKAQAAEGPQPATAAMVSPPAFMVYQIGAHRRPRRPARRWARLGCALAHRIRGEVFVPGVLRPGFPARLLSGGAARMRKWRC